MSDKAAVAAAKEIWDNGDLVILDTDRGIPALAEIISKHYAPRLEAAEKMAEALNEYFRELDSPVKDLLLVVTRRAQLRAALSAWKASQ